MKAHIARTPRVVLAWDLPEGSVSRTALNDTAARLGMTVNAVDAAHLNSNIAGLCGLPIPPYAVNPLFERTDFAPAAVFCGLNDRELDQALSDLRDAGADIPLKAVVTPTSQGWTLAQLLRELSAERDAFAAGQAAVHSED